MENKSFNLLDRFNQWLKESVSIKLGTIGFLMILLLIPNSWIQDLISERQQRAQNVLNEVSEKWSGEQQLTGPILVIPFKYQQVVDKGNDRKEILEFTDQAFFLPENLNVNGAVHPEVLHRGIFDAVVYQADLQWTASFQSPDFKKLKIDETEVLWEEAKLIFGIRDLRGIRDNPILKVGDLDYTTEPSNHLNLKEKDNHYSEDETGIEAKLGWTGPGDFKNDISLSLHLKGSRRLAFSPAGKTTTVSLTGEWPDPSFDGDFLPESRKKIFAFA